MTTKEYIIAAVSKCLTIKWVKEGAKMILSTHFRRPFIK